MKTYTITMAKEKDIDRYYDDIIRSFNKIEVEVDAENVKDAIRKANGYKRMIVWKVDGEIVY